MKRKFTSGAQSVAKRRRGAKHALGVRYQLFAKGPELKYLDTIYQSAAADYLGTVATCGVPAQGTAINQRIGDKITVKEIQFNYEVVGYDAPSNKVRVTVAKWMEDTNVAGSPLTTDFMAAGYPGTGAAPLAPQMWDRIRGGNLFICYDALHALPFNNTTTAPGSSSICRRISIKGEKLGPTPNMQINNAATNGTGVYFWFVSSDSAIAGHPKYTFTFRLIYTDA